MSYRTAALEDQEITEARVESIRMAKQAIMDGIRREIEAQEQTRQRAASALWISPNQMDTVEHVIACIQDTIDDAWHEVLTRAEEDDERTGKVVDDMHAAERAEDFADQGRV